jgi:MmgE/PrpD N-terminal domain
MTRLGRVISGPDILDRGIWPTYFSAPFGIAAVAARMLRLDANQTAHALALALTLAAPASANDMARRIVESLDDRQSLMRLVDEVNQICARSRRFVKPTPIADGTLMNKRHHRYGCQGRGLIRAGSACATALQCSRCTPR